MSKISSREDERNELVERDDFSAEPDLKSASKDEDVPEHQLVVPEKLNICQWVIVAFLYLIFALLVSFIIYISATWNTDRTVEYS